MIRHEGADLDVTAIIVAGGVGRRMGGNTPKQYLPIGGMPVLAWTTAAFERASVVDEIVLVVPESDLAFVAEEIVDAYRFRKVRRIVAGGATRQDSMSAGLDTLEGDAGVVLVHDGVRPFVSERIITEAARCACARGAALVALPIADTVKRVNERGEAIETIPREMLWVAQTPQAFQVAILRRAVEKARAEGVLGTDEAMLVERLGVPVPIVPGEAKNFKITTREDLARAGEIATRKEAPC